MTKPDLLRMGTINPITFQKYERYLPTAFDESLSILEKLNKVVYVMNEIGDLTNEMLEKWNQVYEWVMNEGLEEAVIARLDVWLADGTLDQIINQKLFGDLLASIEQLRTDLDTEIADVRKDLEPKLEKEDLYYVLVDDYGADPTGKTGSSTAIQAAIAAGKHILFSEGATYLIDKTITIPSNRTLTLGRSTTLRRLGDIDCLFRNDSDGITGGYSANTNIHIRGGNIDVNGETYQSRCTVFGFSHCNNVTIEDIRFKDIYSWHFVELNACLDCRVSDCIFDGYLDPEGTEMLQLDLARDEGVFPWFGPYDDTPCRNILIEGNTFKNGRKAIGSHSMVGGVTHDFVKIANNHFDNFSKSAIECYSYARLVIKGNTFYNCDGGVAFRSAGEEYPTYGVTIEGNTFNDINRSESSRAIHAWKTVNRGSICNNVINNVSLHGIGIDYGNWWTVANNVVTNCGQAGIYIYGTNHVTISGNNLSVNNTTNEPERYGITLGMSNVDTTTNVIVIGNYIDSIGAKNTDKTFVTNNTINSDANSSLLEEDNNNRLVVKDNFLGASYQA